MKNNWTSNWSSCDCLADAFGSEWRRFQYLVLAEGAKLHPSCRWDGCTERKSKIVIGQWLPSKVHKWFKLQQSPNWDLFTAAGVYWTGLPRCCEIAFGFSHWIEMLGFWFFVSILFPVFSDYRSIYPLSFRSFFVRHCSPVLCRAVASVWSAGSWRRPPPRERGSARCSSIRTNTCWKDRWVQRPGRTCCSSRLRSRQTGSTERRKTESMNDAQTIWPAGMFFIRNPIWCLCAHHCVYQSAVIHLVSGAAQKKLSKIF